MKSSTSPTHIIADFVVNAGYVDLPYPAIEIAKTRDIGDFIECSVRREENVERTFEALTILMLTD